MMIEVEFEGNDWECGVAYIIIGRNWTTTLIHEASYVQWLCKESAIELTNLHCKH
jgi:hypothetical protein